MTLRTRKSLIYATTAATVVGAIVAAALAVGLPLTDESGTALRTVEHRAPRPSTRPALREDLLAAAMQCELRRPLVDVAPPAPVALPVARPGLQLLGTVVEPGHSMAYVVAAGEKPEFKPVGAVVGGMTIVEIAEGSITLEAEGHREVVMVPKPGSRASAPAARRGPTGEGRDR